MASAIWLLEQAGKSPAEAAEQLTLNYGFFPLERDLKAYFQGYPTLAFANDRRLRSTTPPYTPRHHVHFIEALVPHHRGALLSRCGVLMLVLSGLATGLS